MLADSFLSLVDGLVEGLHLANSLAALDQVVVEFPSETLGPLHAANRALLVAVGGGIQHGKSLSLTYLIYQRGFPEFHWFCVKRPKSLNLLEHRAGIEPANTGFADQRVSHFATGAHAALCN